MEPDNSPRTSKGPSVRGGALRRSQSSIRSLNETLRSPRIRSPRSPEPLPRGHRATSSKPALVTCRYGAADGRTLASRRQELLPPPSATSSRTSPHTPKRSPSPAGSSRIRARRHPAAMRRPPPRTPWRTTARVTLPTAPVRHTAGRNASDRPRTPGRTCGKRVGGKPSRVRISYPPPLLSPGNTSKAPAVRCGGLRRSSSRPWRSGRPGRTGATGQEPTKSRWPCRSPLPRTGFRLFTTFRSTAR